MSGLPVLVVVAAVVVVVEPVVPRPPPDPPAPVIRPEPPDPVVSDDSLLFDPAEPQAAMVTMLTSNQGARRNAPDDRRKLIGTPPEDAEIPLLAAGCQATRASSIEAPTCSHSYSYSYSDPDRPSEYEYEYECSRFFRPAR